MNVSLLPGSNTWKEKQTHVQGVWYAPQMCPTWNDLGEDADDTCFAVKESALHISNNTDSWEVCIACILQTFFRETRSASLWHAIKETVSMSACFVSDASTDLIVLYSSLQLTNPGWELLFFSGMDFSTANIFPHSNSKPVSTSFLTNLFHFRRKES